MSKVLLDQPAYVLHHYPYRDTSLLLEVFSREHGPAGWWHAVRVRRGGAGAANCRGCGPLLLSWSMRGELGTLTECESVGVPAAFPVGEVLSATTSTSCY